MLGLGQFQIFILMSSSFPSVDYLNLKAFKGCSGKDNDVSKMGTYRKCDHIWT